MRRNYFLILCVWSLLLSACGAEAPKKTSSAFETKPVADLQEIMASLVMPPADILWQSVRFEVDKEGIHEYKPKDAEEWAKVRYAAKGLAEAANLLMIDGRAVDQEDWAKFATAMRETALNAAKAAEAKDADKVLETGGYVYDNCKNCHDKYLEQIFEKRTGGKPVEGTPLSAPPGVGK